MTTYYNVYKMRYASSSARNDCILFIETDSPQNGCIMQVTGDIQAGMRLQITKNVDPHDRNYLGKELIGKLDSVEFHVAVGACHMVDPPRQQMDSLGRKIDKSKPYYRSEEWVDDLIEELRTWDVLKD